ncbi:MAG: diacylglycerol kinase family lipid kinase [Bacillota bacterium]|nr:diacylglycerol kinase family lipid kinase [Bacillota bacterium]
MYYFIINPHSKSGYGMSIWKKAEAILKEREVAYEARFTEYTGHAKKLAEQIARLSRPCTLSVLGGDGTLNEVINGLAETDFSHITLGYIPTGSGNDFARALNLSCDVEKCIEAILAPSQCIAVDIGLARTQENSRYFLVSSGIGYDADICRNVMVSPLKKAMNKIHLGKLTYVLIALKLLILYKACPVSVRMDKKETASLSKFFFITGMNMPYEGGGVKFCPKADFQDSLLDICMIGNLSKLKILALFPTAFVGKHGHFQGVTLAKCKRIDISSKSPLPVHCDGESLGVADHLTLQSAGKQINVILK